MNKFDLILRKRMYKKKIRKKKIFDFDTDIHCLILISFKFKGI